MTRPPLTDTGASGLQSHPPPPAREPAAQHRSANSIAHAPRPVDADIAETLYLQYGMVRTQPGESDTPRLQPGHGTGTNQPFTQEHLDPQFQERREEQLRLGENEASSGQGVVSTVAGSSAASVPHHAQPSASDPPIVEGLVNPLANGAGNPQVSGATQARHAAAATSRPAPAETERPASPDLPEELARGN